jgi:hypothetical protein
LPGFGYLLNIAADNHHSAGQLSVLGSWFDGGMPVRARVGLAASLVAFVSLVALALASNGRAADPTTSAASVQASSATPAAAGAMTTAAATMSEEQLATSATPSGQYQNAPTAQYHDSTAVSESIEVAPANERSDQLDNTAPVSAPAAQVVQPHPATPAPAPRAAMRVVGKSTDAFSERDEPSAAAALSRAAIRIAATHSERSDLSSRNSLHEFRIRAVSRPVSHRFTSLTSKVLSKIRGENVSGRLSPSISSRIGQYEARASARLGTAAMAFITAKYSRLLSPRSAVAAGERLRPDPAAAGAAETLVSRVAPVRSATARAQGNGVRAASVARRAAGGSLRHALQPRRAGVANPQELRNTRLMLQIGIVLGLAYLVFLGVWFWTTRFRGRLGRSARV